MVSSHIERQITFLPPLEGRHLLGPRLLHREHWDGCLFGRSREVVGAIVGALGLCAEDIVLAPASLCWDALAPMLAQGVIVRCYPLDSQLRIDTDAIKAMLCHRTKALYVVHYFGYPQRDVSALRAWCSQEGLKLIEDCALCLFDGRHRVGHWGDVSFFSLWKFLPMPDGAIALSRNEVGLPSPSDQPDVGWLAKRMLRMLARSAASGGLVPKVGKLRPSVPELATYEPPGPAELPKPTSMSAISRFILARCDIESIAESRRANYSLLVEGIGDIDGVEPVWREFPENSTPFALPIRVSDPVFLQGALAARGVETEISINRFFRNHPLIAGDTGAFKAVDEMADRVLSLPVHQGMSHSDIERLILVLHEVT